jgi:hypothetical protein
MTFFGVNKRPYLVAFNPVARKIAEYFILVDSTGVAGAWGVSPRKLRFEYQPAKWAKAPDEYTTIARYHGLTHQAILFLGLRPGLYAVACLAG